MKKLVFLISIVAYSLATTVQAQNSDYRIGIKLAPMISFSKTDVEGNITTLERDGSFTRFLVGAFIDMPFSDNYFFSGGLNYATKGTKILISESGGNPALTTPSQESYKHEFLQVPLLLKLYTSEVTLDTRLFVNFGIIPEIKLSTTNEELNNPSITDFNGFDLTGNFGLGLERAIGVNTDIFISAGYYLGFLNQVNKTNGLTDEISIKNNLLSLEIGIKF